MASSAAQDVPVVLITSHSNVAVAAPSLSPQSMDPVAAAAQPEMPCLEPEDDNTDHQTVVLDDDVNAVPMPNPFNMRVVNLSHFPSVQGSSRTPFRSQNVSILRAKAGSVTSSGKSLDLLRQSLQKFINKDIDNIIQGYIEKFFKPGIRNIKANNGEGSVTDEHVLKVCRQILEEAMKMYASETRSATPDFPDNVSEASSLVESREMREKKRNLFHIRRRRRSSDSDSSIVRKRKPCRPSVFLGSGRSTPSKLTVKREGPKWDCSRLTTDTEFIMGARANKALGLGATRGRLYMKHPDVFKVNLVTFSVLHTASLQYSGDQDDKNWLYEQRRMPATGGKAYILLVEDIKELAETDEYKSMPGLSVDEIIGFKVPDWMLEKMKAQMEAMNTGGPNQRNKSSLLADDTASVSTQGADEDDAVPFSSFETKDKLDMLPSPSNTDQLEALSGDDDLDGDGPISPFNMTGGFVRRSPHRDTSLSPAPSDLRFSPTAAERDGRPVTPLTAPFDFQEHKL